MSMLGKVEDLLHQVHPATRLKQGLAILQDYREGRSPEISKIVLNQKAGDKAKILIEGDSLYLVIQCYPARSREEGRFEAHEWHTDLQYLCTGQECLEVCDLRAQGNLPPYDANGNIFFPLGPKANTSLLLEAGVVAVLFPNDAHAPCLRVDGTEGALVRKIVVKVKDALARKEDSLRPGKEI